MVTRSWTPSPAAAVARPARRECTTVDVAGMLDRYGLAWRKRSLGRLAGKSGTEGGEVDETPLLDVSLVAVQMLVAPQPGSLQTKDADAAATTPHAGIPLVGQPEREPLLCSSVPELPKGCFYLSRVFALVPEVICVPRHVMWAAPRKPAGRVSIGAWAALLRER